MSNLVVCNPCARQVFAHGQSSCFCGAKRRGIARGVGWGSIAAASVLAAALAGCSGASSAASRPLPPDTTEVKVIPPDDAGAETPVAPPVTGQSEAPR
jgi:hypothetical protein